MADSLTANYGWILPEVGASAETWGGKLNSNFAGVDALARKLATTAGVAGLGGTPDAWTLTHDPAWTVYAGGLRSRVRAGAVNTAAVTAAADGLAVKPVKTMDEAALPAGFIQAGHWYELTFDAASDCFKIDIPRIASGPEATVASLAAVQDGAVWEQTVGGSYEKWGSVTPTASANGTGGEVAVVFPTPFPTACDNIQVSIEYPSGALADMIATPYWRNRSVSGVSIGVDSSFGAAGAFTVHWRAKGR